MGNVNFNTNVQKNVDLNKQVDLNVQKDVFSFANVQGNLATAEASADAIGGGNGGGGSPGQSFSLLFDDFDDVQRVEANVVGGTDPAADGPQALTIADFPGLQRSFLVDVLNDNNAPPPAVPPGGGAAALGASNPSLGRLAFSSEDGSYANAINEYTDAGGALDLLPVGVDEADILALPFSNLLIVQDANFDPGTGTNDLPATVRVSLVLEDTDGDQAISTVAFVPGAAGEGFVGLDIPVILALLLDDSADPFVPGQVIAGGGVGQGSIVYIGTEGANSDIDGVGDNQLDLDNLSYVQILLEDRPEFAIGGNAFSSADFFPIQAFENLSVDGTDTSVDDIILELETPPEPGGGGILAETDTFAQVQPGGAFSFSESLAASSSSVDDFVFA